MAKGFFHRDAARWVQGDQPQQQIEGHFVEVFEVVFGADGFEFGEGGFHFRQFG